MIKFAYTTDWHLKSFPSDNVVVQDFGATVISRIDQIVSADVDFVIHGGDLSDSYDIADMNLFNKVVQRLYERKKPMYVIPGSHDLIGYAQHSLGWTSLKTLENAGLLTILEPGLNKIQNLEFYVVYPNKQHSVEMYQNLKNKIVLSHNLISPVPVPYPHVRTKDIAKVVDQCLFLCSDLHMAYVDVHESCAFLNPGPLIQSSLSDKPYDAGYFYILFDWENFSCQYKKVLFPPLEATGDIKQASKKLKEFTSKIKIEQAGFDMDELVRRVSNELYKDETVTAEVLKWIHSKE